MKGIYGTVKWTVTEKLKYHEDVNVNRPKMIWPQNTGKAQESGDSST